MGDFEGNFGGRLGNIDIEEELQDSTKGKIGNKVNQVSYVEDGLSKSIGSGLLKVEDNKENSKKDKEILNKWQKLYAIFLFSKGTKKIYSFIEKNIDWLDECSGEKYCFSTPFEEIGLKIRKSSIPPKIKEIIKKYEVIDIKNPDLSGETLANRIFYMLKEWIESQNIKEKKKNELKEKIIGFSKDMPLIFLFREIPIKEFITIKMPKVESKKIASANKDIKNFFNDFHSLIDLLVAFEKKSIDDLKLDKKVRNLEIKYYLVSKEKKIKAFFDWLSEMIKSKKNT